MRLAIMQPYYFPYLGYFQLIDNADKFVIYDNVEFTKKGWINRNYVWGNGDKQLINMNLAKASDYAQIGERKISPEFAKTRAKLLRQLKATYKKAPNFDEGIELVESCLSFETDSLFDFLHNSVERISRHLGIQTEFVVSSNLDADHSLQGKYRVWDVCRHLNATQYLNPEGGTGLYDKDEFAQQGIELSFLVHNPKEYAQRTPEFVPRLSIVDVLLNCTSEQQRELLNDYSIE